MFEKADLIKTSANERFYNAIEPTFGNNTYLLFCDNKHFTKFVEYDLENDKCIFNSDLQQFKFCTFLKHLHNINFDLLLFSDTSNELSILDLRTKNVIKAKEISNFQQLICDYYSQNDQKYKSPDNRLSHDGSLYSVDINGGFEVRDSRHGAKLCEIYNNQYMDVYLLNNQSVLALDKSGTVSHITFEGKQIIFSDEFFLESKAFGGHIPHTMLYDEINKKFIFITTIKTTEGYAQKIVIVDNMHCIISESNPLQVPFSNFICKCITTNGKMFVFFYSQEALSAQKQNTIIYIGEYC